MTATRSVAAAVATILSAVIPPFLVGALAPRIDKDMAFGPAQVGLAMAICYSIAGILSPLGGRIVERLGARRIARIVCALATAGLMGIAVSTTAGHIYIGLAFVGLANALSQPTSNQLLSQVQDDRGRGVSFGVVQASIPSSSLVAGALFAVASEGLDWRWSIGLVAALTLVAQGALSLGRGSTGRRPTVGQTIPPKTTPDSSGRGPLLALVATGFLASTAANTMPSFATTAGLALGLTPLLVASSQVAGSLGSIGVRILAPALTSKLSLANRMRTIAILMAVGAAGFALLASATAPGFLIGSVLVFSCGWGWNSLYNHLVTSYRPDRVAASTGLTQAGVFLGGTAGPLLFAAVAEGHGFVPAWLAMGALMVIATVIALTGARGLSSALHFPPALGACRGGPDPRREELP